MQGSPWWLTADQRHLAGYSREFINANSYKISLQLKNLLLLVAYWPDPGWRMIVWRGVHIPLWPVQGPVAWYDDDPIAAGFSWKDSRKAQAEFHMALALRYDPEMV